MTNKQGNLGSWRFSDILRDFAVTWQLMRDPRVALLLKLALVSFALFYWISPIDLLIGPFDDTAVMIFAAKFFINAAPREAVERALLRLGHRRPTPSDQPDREVWDIWDDDSNNNKTIPGQWRVIDDK